MLCFAILFAGGKGTFTTVRSNFSSCFKTSPSLQCIIELDEHQEVVKTLCSTSYTLQCWMNTAGRGEKRHQGIPLVRDYQGL